MQPDQRRPRRTTHAAPAPRRDERRAVVAPLAEETFKFQFTASRACHDKFRQAQDLLRHRIPDGDLGVIFEKALDLLIEQVKKERFATGRKTRQAPLKDADASSSRHIPDAIKREVFDRDGGRCPAAARLPTSMAAGAARLQPWNSITATASRERISTERTRSACSAVRTTNTPQSRCTVARSWNERARRSTGLQPVGGFPQGECRIIRAGAGRAALRRAASIDGRLT